jgi:hypothetical protein
MADPAIVLLLVLAGDAADPAMQAVVPAAQRPLGEGAVVVVHEIESPPSDEEALALAHDLHAVSAVSVVWEDPAHTRVRLRVILVDGPRRYDYELAFGPRDQPTERGRAIGLAMTPALTRAIAAGSPPENTPRLDSVQATPPSPQLSAVPNAPQVPVTTFPEHTATEPAHAPAYPLAFALDLAGSASVGIGGSALGVGPTLGARGYVLGPFALHVVGVARFGSVDSASASSSTLAVGAGVAWRVARLGHREPVEWGLRVDVLGMQHALAQNDGGAVVRRSRWVTACDLVVEGAWSFTQHFGLEAAVGAELAAGTTAVTVGGATVDHIPVGRIVAELGVRSTF